MAIIYFLTRILTFPGALFRTTLQHIGCRIVKVPIEDVRYLRNGEMCGHIEHALCTSFRQVLVITVVPFTINLYLGCALLLTGAYGLFVSGQIDNAFTYIFVWIGFSCLANCSPCFEDALSLRDYLYSKDTSLAVKVLLSPLFGVYYASAFLERFSLTFVFAALFTYVFPKIFNIFLPLIDKAATVFLN